MPLRLTFSSESVYPGPKIEPSSLALQPRSVAGRGFTAVGQWGKEAAKVDLLRRFDDRSTKRGGNRGGSTGALA